MKRNKAKRELREGRSGRRWQFLVKKGLSDQEAFEQEAGS